MAPQKKGQKQVNNTRKKRRVYTEKELNLPVLNTVTKPAAVQKKRKKGKVFVEDQSALLGILAEVNDAKEGQIRSKLERVKDLEEIRERKRLEIEKKERSKAPTQASQRNPKTQALKMSAKSYAARADISTNALTKSLLSIMAKKQTNLCVAVDVTTSKQLLDIIPLIGPHICVLKLHIDILEDFTPALIPKLLSLKEEYEFLLFEDRKFADIGNTVAHQYSGALYRIADWADLVTVHSVPGPGIITSLKGVAEGIPAPRGILLLAEMSSKGNLCTSNYAASTNAMAKSQGDFVVGFISQHRTDHITRDFLVLTPGVSMSAKGDALGQQYKSPKDAIQKGADIVIVGRGIYEAQDVEASAKAYKEAGWTAYVESLES